MTALTKVRFAARLLTLGAFALVGCSNSTHDLSSVRQVVGVQVAVAHVEPIAQVIDTQGVLFPIHQASLTPKITAPVRTFYVNRGSRVHRGELLAVLDNNDLAAALLSARGSYEQAQANYASTNATTLPEELQAAQLTQDDTQAALSEQQKLYDRESSLYRQGALARKQVEATGVVLTAARSAFAKAEKHLQTLKSTGASDQRKAAQGQLASAHGQYLGAAAQLAYTELRSPIDGVITERAVYAGDIAPASTPLLIVMDTSQVVVRVHIPQSQAAELKLGDAASFHLPGASVAIPAKVTVISPAIDPGSTTVEVWIVADNPKGTLQPGASVEVSIIVKTIPNALVIPGSSLLQGEQGPHVLVAGADGRAYDHRVTTGVEAGATIQVLSGLYPGAKVIVGGAYGLPDQTPIRITGSEPGARSQAQAPA
jgi:HlyD family secretion protein